MNADSSITRQNLGNNQGNSSAQVTIQIVLLAVVVAVLILIFDLSMPLGVAGGVPYVALVLLGIWFPRIRHIYVLAVIGSVLTVVGYFLSPPSPLGGAPWVVITNRLLALFVIWITAVLTARRKQSQSGLERYEQYLEETIEGTGVGIWRWNIQSGETVFNQQWANMMGYSLQEVLPANIKTLKNFCHVDDRGHISEVLEKHVLGECEYFECEARMQHKTGAWMWVVVKGKVIEWDNRGMPVRMLGSLTDITKCKKSEIEVKRIFDLCPDMIGRGNLEGYFNKVNASFSKVLGYEPEEFCKQSFLSYVHEDDVDETAKSLVRAATGREKEIFTIANRYLCKNGLYKWIEWRILAVKDDKMFFAVGRDISDHKLIEQQLTDAKDEAERANRAKSEFLSSMSHELRTPMNAILGFGQMLEFNPREPLADSQKECVDHIMKGGQHLLELINDILDLAKIEVGKVELSIEAVRLEPIIEDCLSLIRIMADEYGIEIIVNDSFEEAPLVRADPTRLKQALLNLMSNAVKYNRKNGLIILGFQEIVSNMIKISVSDTGMGIPDHKMGELFEPFSRLHNSASEIEGTGIGLAITEKLIDRMDGHIGVVSEVGKGSTFWIALPLAKGGLKNVPKETKKKPLAIEDPQNTILYVEDTPASIKLLELIIDDIDNLSLLTAHNGELGIVMAQNKKPDMILMDINLPGMSGFEALKVLRHDEKTREIPVIALSANATSRDIQKGLEAGFEKYLTKPIDVEKITGAIKDILSS